LGYNGNASGSINQGYDEMQTTSVAPSYAFGDYRAPTTNKQFGDICIIASSRILTRQKKEEKSSDFSSKVVYCKILSNNYLEALERVEEFRCFLERKPAR
jgi:hypothetical protein